MENTVLNSHLQLSYPEGFRVMDPQELKQYAYGSLPASALKDPDRHMILTFGYKTVGALAAFLLGAKDMARSIEAQLRRPMRAFGYRPRGSVSRNVGGKKADGYTYTYTAQGIGMAGETLVVKDGRTFYYLYCYMREAQLEESTAVWKEIIASARWI